MIFLILVLAVAFFAFVAFSGWTCELVNESFSTRIVKRFSRGVSLPCHCRTVADTPVFVLRIGGRFLYTNQHLPFLNTHFSLHFFTVIRKHFSRGFF